MGGKWDDGSFKTQQWSNEMGVQILFQAENRVSDALRGTFSLIKHALDM